MNLGLEARTLFEALQRQHPGKFADGQLVDALQRRLKHWRATAGPEREVFVGSSTWWGDWGRATSRAWAELEHHHWRPGVFSTSAVSLRAGSYSNWEDVFCVIRRAESLSDGLQNALWELAAHRWTHRTRPDTVAGGE